ncbi:MAG: primosomal protein N' [Candidatus Zapsychrus exili]|nr:primosomal protein N' [Candidatus Zapsychrus exili]
MTPKIAQVVVDLPLEGPFDYSISDEFRKSIDVGKRVSILFNRKKRVGFVIGFKEKSKFKRLNLIIDVLDVTPSVDSNALKLAENLSKYYGCSVGEAIESYLPSALRKAKAFDVDIKIPLLDKNFKSNEKPFCLLHDMTRFKRWDYLQERIKSALDKNQSVIFLVPSVALIEEVSLKFSAELKQLVVALDKKLTPKKELDAWIAIKTGTPTIVMGTLSAIFAPTPDLGLIVIYDEENAVYKQEQSPFYNIKKIAEMRSDLEGASVILVSVAPTAETFKNAKGKKWETVTYYPDKYSELQVIDMNNYKSQKSTFLSFPLQNMIYRSIEENKKLVLFSNRRGFTTLTRCNQCGFTVKCARCDVSLVYMYSKKKLVCRHCNSEEELSRNCPSCGGSYMKSFGEGIEKLESEVARFYPQARVGRYERDSKEFPSRANVIIATQAILKVQESMSFDAIAVINFDAELNHFDYRATNRAFSLLAALRRMTKSKLMVQTRMKDSYVLKALNKMDFNKFYKKELSLRKEVDLAPYRYLLSIVLRGVDDKFVFEQSNILYDKLNALKKETQEISDIHPDIMPKLRDKYRYTIMLKSKGREDGLKLVKTALKDFKRKKDLIVTVNVDP